MLDCTVILLYLDNVNRSLDQRTVREISRRLAELLAVPPNRVCLQREPFLRGDASDRADLLVSAGGYKFAVAWKASGQAHLRQA